MVYTWLRPEYQKKTEQRAKQLKEAGFKEEAVEKGLGTTQTSGTGTSYLIQSQIERRSGSDKGVSGTPTEPTVSETIKESQRVQEEVQGTIRSPTETRTDIVPGPGPGPTRARDVIRVGPQGPYAPGLQTREEALEEPRKKPEKKVPVTLPSQEAQALISSRFISPQETVSAEYEVIVAEEQRRGQEQFNMPLEQSRKVSELIVGPLENVPKSESVPRGVTAAVEYAITLPAEMLRFPVTVTEMAAEARELGTVRYAGERVKEISRDPSGAGVKAGLTAALIALPVGKFVRGRVVRGRGSSGAPGRTTPAYEVSLGPEDVRATRTGYLSDFIFTQEAKGIRGTGYIYARTEGSEVLLDVSSFTEPQGKSLRTAVEARRVARSKMDLGRADEIRGTVLSEEVPGGTEAESVFLRTAKDAQRNLLGKPAPEQELAARKSLTAELGDVDVAVGRRKARANTMDMPVRDVMDVSGTKLLVESQAEGRVRRVSLTREAAVPTEAFSEKFMERMFRDLGVSQDVIKRYGKTKYSPEEVLRAGIESGLIKFKEVERLPADRLADLTNYSKHVRIRVLKNLKGEQRSSVIAHEIGHFMNWLEGNLEDAFVLRSAYGKLRRAKAEVIKKHGPEKLKKIEKRMERGPEYAESVFQRAVDFGIERMEKRADKFERVIMERGGFRPNPLGKITLQANLPTKKVIMAERAALQAASAYQKVRMTEPQAPSPAIPQGRPQVSRVTGRPVTGLGAIPQPKPRVLEEEAQVIRYPPGEDPPMTAQAAVTELNLEIKTEDIQAEAMKTLYIQRPQTTGRTRTAQEFNLGVAEKTEQLLRQDLGLRQRQELALEQRALQRLRHTAMIPMEPLRERATAPYIRPLRVFMAPRIPFLLPPIFLPGGRVAGLSQEARIPPPRGYRYTPTIAGTVSGITLEEVPKGVITGLEIRPPVKRRRRR